MVAGILTFVSFLSTLFQLFLTKPCPGSSFYTRFQAVDGRKDYAAIAFAQTAKGLFASAAARAPTVLIELNLRRFVSMIRVPT